MRAYFGADELITSYMIGMAGIHFFDSAGHVHAGPGEQRAAAPVVSCGSCGCPVCVCCLPSQLNIGFVVAIAMSVLVYILMFRTPPDTSLRMAGLNRTFATYGRHEHQPHADAGHVFERLSGRAGRHIQHAGHSRTTGDRIFRELRLKGITVALIARIHPLAVIPAALLYSYLESGASIASLMSDVSPQIAGIVQSVIFYLVTAQAVYAFVFDRMNRSRREGPGASAGAEAGAGSGAAAGAGPGASDTAPANAGAKNGGGAAAEGSAS